MRVLKPNWYGIDHAAVAKKFEGNPRFLNDFCVNGEYQPSAVYHCAKPNKRKKHKTYVLLTKSDNGQFYVRGMSPRQIQKYRFQPAIHCLACDDVVYSIMRHDFRSCSCNRVNIDGGKDYCKVGFLATSDYKNVTIDLLTDIISDPK